MNVHSFSAKERTKKTRRTSIDSELKLNIDNPNLSSKDAIINIKQKVRLMAKLDLIFIVFLVVLLVFDVFAMTDYAKLHNKSGFTGTVVFLLGDLLVLFYYLAKVILPYIPPRTPRSKK